MIFKKLTTLLIISLLIVYHNCYADNHIITINITENDDKVTILPQLNFNTSAHIKEAIDNGIRIQFIVKAQLYQPRSWWFNKTIDNTKINLEVSYFTLGKLYIVKNKDTGEQLGFNDYEQVWVSFEKLMTFTYSKALTQGHWFKLRIMLDKGALPTAMQLPVLFDSHWDINTPWYQHSLDIQ